MFTLKDLLDYAIQQEIDSQTLYRRGAELVKDAATQQFLRRLEKEEVEHEKMLFNIRETGLYNLDVAFKEEHLLEDAKHSHGSNLFIFDERWTMENVLEIALKREYRARLIYEAAAQSAPDEEMKMLFKNLAAAEAIHHREVEKQYKLHRGTMGEEL